MHASSRAAISPAIPARQGTRALGYSYHQAESLLVWKVAAITMPVATSARIIWMPPSKNSFFRPNLAYMTPRKADTVKIMIFKTFF